MRPFIREGYGAMFCDLFLDQETIVKRAKNEEGRRKLQRELAFYKILKKSGIDFPVPSLLQQDEHSYTMKYYHDFVPLYRVYWNTTSDHQTQILSRVYSYLDTLHTYKLHSISKKMYLDSFIFEVYTKPLARFIAIEPFLRQYSFTHVNGVKLDTFQELLDWIQQSVTKIIEKKKNFEFCVIHGDCQFNNILYKEETSELLFIDPRGYFGTSEIFGPVEYDSAKLLFALSGYDLFDSMNVTSLEYEGDSLILPILWKDETLFQRKGLDILLFLSIWLSNAHSFLETPKKAVFSYYYALYISTLVKMSSRDDTK